VIGAGTGNDVSRALAWGARRVDAVEIDPVILRLGKKYHPDAPYQDPRVHLHLGDGRNFLRSTSRHYDLIIFGLVDSLVMHSSYSNIRLESFLFTDQAFADVRAHLKPGGWFVAYNYFRRGWIVCRMYKALTETFGSEPLVLTLPAKPVVNPQTSGGLTMIISDPSQRLRTAFRVHPDYWLAAGKPAGPNAPDGFYEDPPPGEPGHWERFGAAKVQNFRSIKDATDDWPFLYLNHPMVTRLGWEGIATMGGLAFLMLALFSPGKIKEKKGTGLGPRMFFLGAGFMLVETRAVVYMALLFGTTWIVNTIVFFAVLVMILLANLYVLKFHPRDLRGYYAGLVVSLGLNVLIPMDFFLGISRGLQVLGSCLLVFTPILFAGVIFAVAFNESARADRDFGVNVAGAMFGGLAEYSSMLVGFRLLGLIALLFYVLSAVLHPSIERLQSPVIRSESS
ncbi:MAG: spermidine synthase, partial [Terriglobia bacterium]